MIIVFCLFINGVIHSDKFLSQIQWGKKGKQNQYLVLSTSKLEPVLEVAKSCLQNELVPRQYTLQGDTAY